MCKREIVPYFVVKDLLYKLRNNPSYMYSHNL